MSRVVQRCIFVEGIGRCHALGTLDDPIAGGVAAMDYDGVAEALAGFAVLAIIAGDRPGRILWSVRFTEKAARD